MNKNSIVDYSSCILVRLFALIIRSLPKKSILFLGRRIGDLFYYFDLKHKTIAYANVRTVFGDKLSPDQLSHLTKEFYRTFGQNLIEIFMIPLVDKEYMNKYVTIEGLNYIAEGFKRGKGMILLGMHEGSWELSNIICANLGFPFVMFVRDQRYPRLDKLLNLFRIQKGCQIIYRQNGAQQLIQALKGNQAIGMTTDQGGKSGILVQFFGKDASMPSGAIRLALKYNATIIPAFYTRIKGPQFKVIIGPPFEIKKTPDLEKDIHDNLQEIVHIFERYILRYPQEYLWTYKIWKYGKEKNILILSDGKTGHLRQAQAVANIVSASFKEKGMEAKIDTLEVKFKSELTKTALIFSSSLAGKYHCQGCLWCLRTFLREDVYKSLIGLKPDIVISCGSALAPINFVLSRESLAKSIVVMRPSILSTKRFNLVIMPRHDHPPKRKNVVSTEGALNLINEEYLKSYKSQIANRISQENDKQLAISNKQLVIGLLIGGDTKDFLLTGDTILEVIKQIKSIAEKLNAEILVTTSRRTNLQVEHMLKEEFKDYLQCRLLIIANEKNIPEAVGGILGLSQIIITSPESISMISEAVNSQKYVLVFKSSGLSKKHKMFLDYFAKNKYIYLIEASDLARSIEEIWMNRPSINTLKDNLLVSEAIKRIL